MSNSATPWTVAHQTPLSREFSRQEFLPGSSDSKESAYNAGDPGSIPGSGKLKKEKATHSSILAWRIPWTEEPGRLHSMESQRVRHDQVTDTFTSTSVSH